MSITFTLVLDLAIAVLLIATIAYAVILNRKLTNLRAAQSDLRVQIGDFKVSTERAEGNIRALREAAREAGAPLQTQVEQADRKFGELKFLVERADALADRLEQATAGRRGTTSPRSSAVSQGSTPGSHRAPNTKVPGATTSVSPDQASLIEALQGLR